MKHIIVPIDFSENSLNGLELAIMLINKTGGHLQMVYVQKNSLDYSPGSVEGENKWAEEQFNQILNKYKSRLYSNVKFDYIIKYGKIFHEIVNQVHAFNDSFLVCSTHGASGFEEYIIGSNAFKIISYTYKPVFVMRGNKIPLNLNKIVLPIDITPDTRQKIPFTAEIAKNYDAEVHILKVTTSSSKEINEKLDLYGKQVADYFDQRNIKHITERVNGTNITDITLDYATSVKANLISIMSNQEKNLSNFILGSYTQQILNKTTIPVLIVSPKELHINSSFQTQG